MADDARTIGDYMTPLGLLCLVWGMFEDEGHCDALGGAQWRRMADDWHRAGRPDPMVFVMAWLQEDGLAYPSCGRP